MASAGSSSSLVALDGDAAMHLKHLTKREATTKIKALQVPPRLRSTPPNPKTRLL
jgi:hypothetical protein